MHSHAKHSQQQQQQRGGAELAEQQQQSPSVLPAEMPVAQSTAAKRPDVFGTPDPHLPAAAPCPSAHDLSPAGDAAAAAEAEAGSGGASSIGPGAATAATTTSGGPAAAAGATAKGAPPANGLDAIIADHQVIRQLFYRCNNARTDQERLAATRDLVRHVSRHASAEERTLYPLARDRLPDKGTGRMLYDRMVMDDTVNKQLLDWLESHTPRQGDAAQWALHAATLQKFQSIEEEHLSREEAEVIEPLRSVMTPAETAKLGKAWAAAWANAPTHPHPRGPTAAPGAHLLHPLVGVIDRLRDAVAER
ncbi:hypothetical protein HYH02_014877 [Chlamydomonas schloesseri]|uniref:Hemerythrin-like domain-containing protein n=1 Tax=Chlamydomonas schloesseri TaxID=2026947 RepID=A0A835SSL7_9CHLO|nr:hypothetical protein HYH02_014877 [Chlamydomonas schloesseri]|eukprot:KAG2426015.1 hypothetical protein HYH02_014877 [Chlamydomonas schloesseri]